MWGVVLQKKGGFCYQYQLGMGKEKENRESKKEKVKMWFCRREVSVFFIVRVSVGDGEKEKREEGERERKRLWKCGPAEERCPFLSEWNWEEAEGRWKRERKWDEKKESESEFNSDPHGLVRFGIKWFKLVSTASITYRVPVYSFAGWALFKETNSTRSIIIAGFFWRVCMRSPIFSATAAKPL